VISPAWLVPLQHHVKMTHSCCCWLRQSLPYWVTLSADVMMSVVPVSTTCTLLLQN